MRRMLLAFLLAAALGAAGAQQPNSPAARMLWNGTDGPPFPISVFAPPGPTTSLSLEVGGAPGSGFITVFAPNGLVAGSATFALGILDIDTNMPVGVILDGIGFTTGSLFDLFANTGSSGAAVFTFPLDAALAGGSFGTQSILQDGANPPFLLTFTAGTDVMLDAPSGIFVSPAGSPSNPGTSPGAPLATIGQGLAVAAGYPPPRPTVFVAAGAYVESPSFVAGVDVRGGLDPLTFAAQPGIRSIVLVGTTPAVAHLITSPTTIRDLSFQAVDAIAPLAESIAVASHGAGSALEFVSCEFIAGDGGPGLAGAAGSVGAAGQSGFSASGTNGGFGGVGVFNGGRGGDGDTGNGDPGLAGQGPAGGSGGPPTLSPAANGAPGGPGGAGNPGPNGSVSPVPLGTVVPGQVDWSPGMASGGQPGTQGSGGGGGAAGGGIIFTSAGGGGGGGAGGGPGSPGGGGVNGAGSFGVLLNASSPTFVDCHFETGDGGNGGNGGHGGNGGSGGNGGNGGNGSSAGDGGDGGHGGNGGVAGAGAGGTGGPSIGLIGFNSAPTLVNPSFSLGQPGPGGPGGTRLGASPAPSGPNGTSASTSF